MAPSIFAEMDIELQKVMEDYQLTKLSNNDNGTLFTPVTYSKLGIEDARQSFTESVQRAKSYCHAFSYWYLRLYDTEWLEQYLRKKMRVLPTIAQDRNSALLHIKSGTLRYIVNSPLIYRLCMRDNTLYEKIRQLLMVGGRGRNRTKPSVKELRSTALSNALQSILADEVEPERITYGMLAKRVNLSFNQASYSILASPKLKTALDEANRDKTRRQWNWAIRMEHDMAKGVIPKIIHIVRRAKLPATPEARKYIRWYMAELQKEKVPKG